MDIVNLVPYFNLSPNWDFFILYLSIPIRRQVQNMPSNQQYLLKHPSKLTISVFA